MFHWNKLKNSRPRLCRLVLEHNLNFGYRKWNTYGTPKKFCKDYCRLFYCKKYDHEQVETLTMEDTN